MKKRIHTIDEVRQLVKHSTLRRLPPCDRSDINQQIVRERELGFEAVLTGNGNEKVLLPEDGAVVYLFRGQNQECPPCLPTLYREFPRKLSPAEIFIERMRLGLFRDMLDSYPIVDKFFKRHNFRVDYEGLAQHYGLPTSVLDLTSNLDIAFFFATCKLDKVNDCYRPFDDGEVHEGIIYVFCQMLANEPTPCRINDYLNENITPIGLQPFLRPARQKGYALHIPEGRSTKSWAYRFRFSDDDSRRFFDMFDGGKQLWVSDILADKTKIISGVTEFSFAHFAKTFEEFRPKGYSRTQLKKELSRLGIRLAKQAPAVLFSEEEKAEAIRKWNSSAGAEFCKTIGRRPWHETMDESEARDERGEKNVKVGPLQPFRTLRMLANSALIMFLADPQGPDEAEWINYYGTPTESKRRFSKAEQEWTRVPGCMYHLFAKNYLTESDYLIKN